MKRRILGKAFFDQPTLLVARELIGKFLVHRVRGREHAYLITETEAYDGFRDRASHASRGKTSRNAPMFGRAGVWYIYLIYGMYEMLNIVTRESGYPAAVLIRGVDGLNGPGKLTKALGISRKYNKASATRTNGLWVEERGVRPKKADIRRAARIGVDYAGPMWSKKHWRFVLIKYKESTSGKNELEHGHRHPVAKVVSSGHSGVSRH
jgi:DNA-3-methyladenine glycosylase